MEIKLISLFVAVALVSALSAFAAEPMPEVRVAGLGLLNANAGPDTEIVVNYQGRTLDTARPIIVAQGDVIPTFGTEEQSIQIDRERVIKTKDYEKPSARPDFCNYDYEPRGGPSYPPSDFVPPC